MARRSLIGQDEATEINLSPMIDCIFILLIFFIVTTVFVDETGLQVEKPDAAATSALADDTSLSFEITSDNKIMCAGLEIGLAEVTERVRTEASSQDVPVTIRAHEKAKHGTFVALWDAAKLGGAQTLSFSTVN